MLQDNLRLQRRRFLATVLGSGLYFWLSQSQAAAVAKKIETTSEIDDHAIRDAIKKAQNFEHDYPDDIYLNATQSQILTTAQQRLTRLQRTVGYANFNLISFDAAVKYAKRYSVIGAFSLQELALIEMLFANDAKEYGFLGEKVSTTLTDVIRRNDVLKVRGTGHYVYKGEALNTYTKISKVIGPDLQLTSGVRSVVKQLHLFMAKAVKSNGNLSRASRSLAPPEISPYN